MPNNPLKPTLHWGYNAAVPDIPPPPAPVQLQVNPYNANLNALLDGLYEGAPEQAPKDQELPISKQYAFGPMMVEKAKHLAYEQQQPANEYKILCETALLGIEIEVENMTKAVPITHYWKLVTDGSLRNHGVEFTSIPLRGKQLEPALRHLRYALRYYNNPDFSIRTSCHVHLNVRDMTWDQIKTLVLLYAIFERHFFTFAGTKREESIFCVPIYKTNLLGNLDNYEQRLNSWHKYCALNLIPIIGKDDTKRYGTVEFRHLYGTDDPKTIIEWCNQILCLRQATQKYKYAQLKEKIKELNTTSEYVALYANVFGEYADMQKMSKHDFEYCISQAKKELFGKDYHDKLKLSKQSLAYLMMHKVGVI